MGLDGVALLGFGPVFLVTLCRGLSADRIGWDIWLVDRDSVMAILLMACVGFFLGFLGMIFFRYGQASIGRRLLEEARRERQQLNDSLEQWRAEAIELRRQVSSER